MAATRGDQNHLSKWPIIIRSTVIGCVTKPCAVLINEAGGIGSYARYLIDNDVRRPFRKGESCGNGNRVKAGEFFRQQKFGRFIMRINMIQVAGFFEMLVVWQYRTTTTILPPLLASCRDAEEELIDIAL